MMIARPAGYGGLVATTIHDGWMEEKTSRAGALHVYNNERKHPVAVQVISQNVGIGKN